MARKYRRDGYKVTTPQRADAAPLFLGDFLPDLVAESDADNVIVEVRRASDVAGSNDLVELADRVSAQAGWRLELVTVADETIPTSQELLARDADIEALLKAGFVAPAFAFAHVEVENIAAALAIRYKLKTRDLSFLSILRELVTMGLVSAKDYDELSRLSPKRNSIFHRVRGSNLPTARDVQTLVRLGKVLKSEVDAAEAA